MKKILILTALLFASCSNSGFERNARTIEEMKQCEAAGLVAVPIYEKEYICKNGDCELTDGASVVKGYSCHLPPVYLDQFCKK